MYNIAICAICAFSATAQIETSSESPNDSVSSYMATLIEDIDMRILIHVIRNRNKVYPTENIYNY